MNQVVIQDFHIRAPFRAEACERRQMAVLDMIDAINPDILWIPGDIGEFYLKGIWHVMSSPVWHRLELAPYRVVALGENWPHASLKLLLGIKDQFEHIEVWPYDYVEWVIDGQNVRALHGHQFDHRLQRWLRFQWLNPILPWVGRNILRRLPSQLALSGNYGELNDAVTYIHKGASKYADKHDCIVLLGHDHACFERRKVRHQGASGYPGHAVLAHLTDKKIEMIPLPEG